MRHRFTLLSTLPDIHKPYEEAPMHVPDHDLEPLSMLYAALCVTGAPTGDATATRAVALLGEVDGALGFEVQGPQNVQELLADLGAEGADGGDPEDDEEEEEEEEDDDNEENEEEEAALDARVEFVELVCDLLKHGADAAKVVGQAKAIAASFTHLFETDEADAP